MFNRKETKNSPRPIAICFFGITRSLRHTISSIEKNVLSAASEHGDTKIYSHFFVQHRINNPRSKELGSYDLNEYKLLKSDWLKLEAPDLFLNEWNFTDICTFGDSWNDDCRSLRNLIHQLHSLRQVTLAVREEKIETCIFCRPDLFYHDSLKSVIRRALRAKDDRIQLPYWQSFGGFNDRFAICTGAKAIKAYGCRIELINRFCQELGMLHSEKLVRFALQDSQIDVQFIGARASRVRIGGHMRDEDFQHPKIKRARNALERLKKALSFSNMFGIF